MNQDRWQKVKGLFDAVVELAPKERKRFLDKSCGTDEELRREVETLLASYTDAESFMEQPAAHEVADFIIEPKNLEAGKSFGHYKIINLIGAGGMGEVYLAKDNKLDRKVAVKILNEKFAKHESNLHRFIKEAKAASALNHPNILVIHEIGEAEETNYIVSEYIEGETLRDILKTEHRHPDGNDFRQAAGVPTLAEILDISVQIANALVAAHSAKIVHRDIKPENIIVRPDGYVKILDFGLAKLVEQKSFLGLEDKTAKQNETAKGVILGTVNYMSPEQAKGEKVDERTDIFSFGVLLYEMIAGRTPFAGGSMSETFANLINKEPPPLARFSESVPEELQRIISKTLRKNKDERYQTMKGLLADLKSLQRRLEFETELNREGEKMRKGEKEKNTLLLNVSSSPHLPFSTSQLPPNNLSENIFPIVGREKEIAEIKNVLRQTNARLLTMTGIGGTGKTTLARAVAGELLDEFADGVFFIGLAAITDSELVVSSIGQPLGVKEAGGKPLLEILKDYLRGKQILLVLDNFEQVTDAAPIVAELLSAANQLKILITSRTLLYLSAEREFVVPPLSLPSDISQVSFADLSNYEAVKLFDQSARNIKPNFALTEENAPDVAEICARLDGLPLAIELAAARIKILSPRAILAKLENRLKLLTGGASDLPARQQTMRGAIEWSYDVLTDNEKKLFRRLSVFAGGFSFEAAEAVCGNYESSKDRIEVLDLITSLVDKNLLVQKEQPNDEFRFRMLEVVREYAAEVLEASGESEATRKNHAAFFLQLAETAQPHFFDEQGAKWLDRLEEEYDNLRAALSWSVVSDTEMTINLAVAVRTFWILHNHLTEGRKWFEAALERATDAPSDIRFKLLYGFGQAAIYQGDIETARQMYEESLAVSKEAGEKRQVALASRGLGTIAKLRGDFSTARKFIDESLKISRELNDKLGIAVSLNNLGDLARMESDFKTARPLLEEALAISRALGNKEGICGCLNNLGASAFGEGNFAAASIRYAEAITTALDLGDKITVSYSLDGFAALALKRGKKENAARLAGAVEHLHQSIGFVVEPAERRFRDAYLSELKIKMDKAAFSEFYEQGRKMKLEEAVALCLEENPEDETSNKNSIAVLPFSILGLKEDDEYLGLGLADALITQLSRTKQLVVRPTSAVRQYVNEQSNTATIGRDLRVGSILEGSLQRSGERLRVTVQLVNTEAETPLWAEKFDTRFTDIFDVQDKIALQVAAALLLNLNSAEQEQIKSRWTENFEAYQLYLKARFYLAKSEPDALPKAIALFRETIALESQAASAYAGLAESYISVSYLSAPHESLPKAREAAQKAIELDSQSAEAHVALGVVNSTYDWDWHGAEREFKLALELNPNYAMTYRNYGIFLVGLRRFDEAFATFKKGLHLDPLSLPLNAYFGLAYVCAGDAEKAIEQCRKTLELDPRFLPALGFLSQAYWAQGDFENAVKTSLRQCGIQRAPISLSNLAHAYACNGQTEEARKILAELEAAPHDFPLYRALIYLGLKERGKMWNCLERAVTEHVVLLPGWLNADPRFQTLRDEPRFQDLLRRMNLENFGTSPAVGKVDLNKSKPLQSENTNEKSIAVLPFVNMSADAENEYFCDGLAEELLNALAKIKNLKVAARTSAFSFKNRNVNVSEIGNALNVENILEGSVRRAGNRLRISVKLVNASNGFQIWSERYDGEMKDVFDLQDEITLAVIDELKVKFQSEEKSAALRRYTDDPKAYEFYLKGIYYRWKLAPEEFGKCLRYFEQAAETDPNFALAYFGVASYYGYGTAWGLLPIPPREGWTKAEAAIAKAMKADDALPENQLTLAAFKLVNNRHWAEAGADIERVAESNPKFPEIHHLYGFYLLAVGRFDASVAEAERALELDPLSLNYSRFLGICFFFARRYDEAVEQFNLTLELEPNNASVHEILGGVFAQKGFFAEAVAAWQRAATLEGDDELAAVFNLHKDNFAEAAQAAASKRIERMNAKTASGEFVLAINFARAYLMLGDDEQTFYWLEKAVEEHNVFPLLMNSDPFYDRVRADARFQDLLRRVGFPADENAPVRKTDETNAPTLEAQTKTGLTARSEIDGGENKKRFLIGGLIIFLLSAVSFGYYFWSVRKTTSGADGKKSLAVLPFVNVSQDANAEYLSDGITESVINNLSQLSGLKVMSRNSAFRFKNNQTDTKNIALQLGVETLVTGDIKQLGDKLIINVRLIDASDDSQIWGNQYIKSSADILAVQNEIAQAVAQNLRVKLTGTEQQQLAKRPTENVEAYQLYLRGRFHVFKLTPPEIQQGISYFQQAIDLDPNYALAYAGLSDAYRSLGIGSEINPAENFPKAKAAANKAIEIDETLSEGYSALGATNLWLWNWNAAESNFKRALELNSNNVNAHLYYAHFLSNTGRHSEALAEIKLARELDPLFPFAGALEGQFLLHAGRTDEALARLQKTFELVPNFWMPHAFISSVYIEKGMYDEAIAEARKASELSPAQTWSIAVEGYALAKSGKQDEARNLLDKLLKLSNEHFIPASHIALIYNGLGETDKALEWLEKGYEQHDPKMAFLKVEPKWNNLRNEPRFIEVMRRINFE